MTKKELIAFRAKLENAKVGAMRNWPNVNCILYANNWYWNINATFDKGGDYDGQSGYWVRDHTKSADDIARVFDLSIADLDKRIKEMTNG